MNKNEEGFSLIELAVSAAIMAMLITVAYNQLSGISEAIKAQAAEAQQQNIDALNSITNGFN